MGEAIISRAGGGSGSGGKKKVFRTQIYRSNQKWKVPELADNNVSVEIFGGGGGGSWYGGGCGGCLNNGIIDLGNYINTEIEIIIGKGGNRANNFSASAESGGSTSFGSFLMAIGGSGGINTAIASDSFCGGSTGSSYFYRSKGGISLQFGGGGGFSQNMNTYNATGIGIGGGKYGGGGGGSEFTGDGGEYGGGGGGGWTHTGNGGRYGGGGGGGAYGYSSGLGGEYGGGSGMMSPNDNTDRGHHNGGKYGGNGGGVNVWNNVTNAEAGTNTNGWTNTEKYPNNIFITGYGKAGTGGTFKPDSYSDYLYHTGGGGGFGGNGGNMAGGGGGYGSNGGDRYGGGGGFGGDGGNNWGGGGGYYSKGGDNYGGGGGYGSNANGGSFSGGGGGYYSRGGDCCGGGGGYGLGMDGNGGSGFNVENRQMSINKDGGVGAGGGGVYPTSNSQYMNMNNFIPGNGGNGICIIQYYAYE